MKKKIGVILCVFALLTVTVFSSQANAEEIFGCYHKKLGQFFIVSDHGKCKKSEQHFKFLRLEIEDIVDGGIASAYFDTTGEGGIFVGTLTSDRIGFITNSAERVSISPDGNVGIGTTEPLKPLHVQGSAYVYEKLGIGVDTPTNNLQVSGTKALFSSWLEDLEEPAATEDFRVFISKKFTTDTASLIFQDNHFGHAELGLTSDNDFHIKVSADGMSFTDAIVVDHTSGNVGIGSTSWEPGSPPSKLFVFATDDTPAIFAEQFGTAPSLIVSKNGSGDAMRISKEDDPGFGLHIVQRGSNSALVISNDLTPESRVFAIRNDGSVGIGIGNTVPTEKLEVNGYIKATGYKSSSGSVGLTRTINLKGSDGNNCTLAVENGLITGTTCP